MVKIAGQINRVLALALQHGLLDHDFSGLPVLAQGHHHRGLDQALDIGARRVMRAQTAALLVIQGVFEQGAENRRINLGPVGAGGGQQFANLFGLKRIGLGVFEQIAIEVQKVLLKARKKAFFVIGLVHLGPEVLQHGGKTGRGWQAFLDHFRELALGQEVHILGKHGEDAAHQEMRHRLRIMALFQGLADRR